VPRLLQAPAGGAAVEISEDDAEIDEDLEEGPEEDLAESDDEG